MCMTTVTKSIIVLISIMVRREGTTRIWAEASENKGKMGIMQYVLYCNSPMSYDS